MALTGLAIVAFLFLHAIGNLQFWIGPEAYNTYAAFLQAPLGLVEFLWLLRIGLFVCLILHIISAVYLRLKNNAAKPIGYQVKNYAKAKLTSRTMLWTGLLVLSGATLHLLHFTAGVIDIENGYETYEAYPTGEFVMGVVNGCSDENTCCNSCNDAKDDCCATEQKCDCKGQQCCKTECTDKSSCNCCCSSCSETPTFTNYEEIRSGGVLKYRHDVYGMVSAEFSNPWVAIVYIIFVMLVGFHLNHAIQSGIHTLGIEGPKFTPVMRVLSTLLSIGLVLLFIILPLGVLINSLGFCNCIVGGF
jgi:succinate dehydrogenase/fumarate reductase cytochrome b subunit